MRIFAVFCLSASSLLYELFLTRYFSIAHWNHLSFMVIGIAMLGYGASGAVFALAARPREYAMVFPIVSLACAASVLGSFLSLRLIPLDYLRLPVEPVQLCYLLLTELVLSIPFFFAGLGSCLAYVGLPERSGLVAFASMIGSGAGSLAPVFLLTFTGRGRTGRLGNSHPNSGRAYSLYPPGPGTENRLPSSPRLRSVFCRRRHGGPRLAVEHIPHHSTLAV